VALNPSGELVGLGGREGGRVGGREGEREGESQDGLRRPAQRGGYDEKGAERWGIERFFLD